MSAFTIKIIALIAMVIDHTGAILFPQYIVMRYIGRITFPIMAFFIGEGYKHTRNFNKYLGTMVVFAIIAEIPFDLALYGSMSDFYSQNVLWTFVVGLIAAKLFETFNAKDNKIFRILGIVAEMGCYFVADIVTTDYAGMGVLLVLLMCEKSLSREYAILLIGIWSLMLYGLTPFLYGIAVALLLLAFYNGQRGVSRDNKAAKYLFYIFYPAHLLIIAMINLG